MDPVDLVVWNAGKRVGEPGLGIDSIELGVPIRVQAMAADFPPVCGPTKMEFLRPKATERIARPAVLLSISRMP